MIFIRLPIVFFIVGNHGDISRFLQELINQMETMVQQQVERIRTFFFLIEIYCSMDLVKKWLANFFNFIRSFH